MLTAGSIDTRRDTGEVCPRSGKMSRNRAVGAGHGGQGGKIAVAKDDTAPFRLPVGLGSDYPVVNQGRMDRLSGKCRFSFGASGSIWRAFRRLRFRIDKLEWKTIDIPNVFRPMAWIFD